MDLILMENYGEIKGNVFLWRAQTLIAICQIEERKNEEATERLEEIVKN
jgi:tetratricopeptide (TPR) repeat protein